MGGRRSLSTKCVKDRKKYFVKNICDVIFSYSQEKCVKMEVWQQENNKNVKSEYVKDVTLLNPKFFDEINDHR